MTLPKMAIDGPGISQAFEDATAPVQTVLYSADDEGARAIAGGPGGGSSGVVTTSSTTSPFVINIAWDSSVAAAPAGFQAGVLAAAQYLESQFTDAVTVNISVGFGEVNGTPLGGGALGSSASYLVSTTYSTLRSAVIADARSPDDRSAIASLPTSAPVAGSLWTTTANAKALGMMTATNASTDGYVGFSNTLPFTYSDDIAGGTYDFTGVVLHELTEVMGRGLITGATIGASTPSYELMDLFHYAASGVRDFSAGTPGYLSADGGVTQIGNVNTAWGGDAGDWSSAMGNDSFNAFSNAGVVNPVSAADLRTMDIIGWNRALLSGIKADAATAALGTALSSSKIAANTALATISEIGGPANDSYRFALGGPAAANFALTTNGGSTTLSTIKAISGAAGGKLYALNITATDTTPSPSVSVTSPLLVITGSSGADTVSVATLAATLGTGAACFVYGLAGNDTIDATGMTGRAAIAGDGGADRMTGGSGGNTYLYGAASDSTNTAMDVITNFRAAADLIDLTGLGQPLAYTGRLLAGSKLAAHSVGYQIAGGNTFVLVNTSGVAEGLNGTNMKIELLGSMTLGSSNIAHL